MRDILGESEVEGVLLEDLKTGEKSELPCKGYFSALGHVPNTGLVKDQLDIDDKGYLKVEGNTSLTKLAGVFAAGDCCDPRYRQAINAAASGCRAAMDAEKYLESK